MADPRETDDEIDGIEDEAEEGLDAGADAGQIDYEGGDDAEAGQESEGAETQERVSRSSRRDDRIREELRAEREHRARVEAELSILRQERQQASGPREETDAEFMARISLLDSEQRMEARLDRAIRQNTRQNAINQFTTADRLDKAAYDTKAASDPMRRKHAARVEQLLQVERRNNRDFPRETIYKFILGDERDTRLSQGKPSPAQRQGQQRIQSQQARTTGGRGDQGREQRATRRFAPNDMSPEAVKQRLESDNAYI